VALVAASATAGLPPLTLTRSSWVAIPFALIAFPLVFTRPGAVVVAGDIGAFHVAITDAGLRDFATIAAKSWISVQVALLLAMTTPIPDLIDGLRAMRLPRIMVAIISFMVRYLEVLADEASRMERARSSRAAQGGPGTGGSILWRARVTGGLVGALFLRAYERSERIHAAMLARGFEGELRTVGPPPLGGRAIALTAGGLAVIAGWLVVSIMWLPHA
jgi:cobalt/nickel transport system permease protein